MLLADVIAPLLLVTPALAASLYGKVVGVPDDILAAQKAAPTTPVKVLNGNNFQSRISADLIPLYKKGRYAAADYSRAADSRQLARAVLNRNYEFQFDGLVPGTEYELVVNSYDFVLADERFRIVVGAETAPAAAEADEAAAAADPAAAAPAAHVAGGVYAFAEKIGRESYNASSEKLVSSAATPLLIEVGAGPFKQYYEQRTGALSDMVMGSPFGFIFANTMYTVIFAICVLIMAGPYILSWVAPEFLNEMQDIKEAAKTAAEKIEPNPAAAGISKIGSNSGRPANTGATTGSAAGRAIQNARQRK